MRGEEIALQAMKKEHARLRKIADKAKAEVDAYCSVGSEMISIYDELRKIIESKETGKHILDKLSTLQKREKAAKKLMAADFTAISERQYEAESNAMAIAGEISRLELRLNLRSGKYT